VQASTAVENVPPHGTGDPTQPVPFFGGLGLYNQGDTANAPNLVDQSAVLMTRRRFRKAA